MSKKNGFSPIRRLLVTTLRIVILSVTLFFRLFIYPVSGQTINRQSLNRETVNYLLKQLQSTKSDESKISLLLELGKFQIYKPGEAKADLDSASAYLNKAYLFSNAYHLPAWQHQIVSLLVVIDMEKGQHELGKSRFLRLIQACRKTDDKEGEAMARLRYGTSLTINSANYSAVLQQYKQALALYQALGNRVNESHTLKDIAYIHINEGKLDLAQTELLTILTQYKAAHYPNLHYTYNLLSTVSRLKGDFSKGLQYALQCVESIHKSQDSLLAANAYGDLARMYLEVGNHDKSLEWYKKSLNKWRQEKQANHAMFADARFIVSDLIAKKRAREGLQFIVNLTKEIPTNTVLQKGCVALCKANCYEALQMPKLAEKFYLESLKWYGQLKYDFEESLEARRRIGQFYLSQTEYGNAGYHLRKVLNYFPQSNALASIKDIHFMLFKVDSAEKNYLAAIDHFRLHKKLNDSIFNERRSKQIEELQVQYETREKEQNIRFLHNQSKLQKSQLKQAEMYKTVTLVGILLLLTITGLLYNRYRLKQRSNQQLETNQELISQKNESLQQLVEEKEWLLKEIHHRVKNNLHTITSLLESQSAYLQGDALAAIRDSQHRVFAMSLIHQKLYLSNNLAAINMAMYLPELVSYLRDSFDTPIQIRFELDIAPIELEVSQAVPLGLILNEAITNALKYAFPDGRSGLIAIAMRPVSDEEVELSILDDGIGLPLDFDSAQSPSLGMRLMNGLSEDIDAQFYIEDKYGTKIVVRFGVERLLDSLKQAPIYDKPTSSI